MLDTKAFRCINYGLYLVSSCADGKTSGCTVNAFIQVTSEPFQLGVAINKENHTCTTIQKAGKYTATVLSESATMELIGKFGFHSSRDIDKFEFYSVESDNSGLPYVLEHAVARFSVLVTDSVDLGTHIFFIGTVTEAEVLSDEDPMTYAYYHAVKGGKTPPKAASYIPPEKKEEQLFSAPVSETVNAWLCTVCGYIEYADKLPEDFKCPVCGAGPERFKQIKEDRES